LTWSYQSSCCFVPSLSIQPSLINRHSPTPEKAIPKDEFYRRRSGSSSP
jgi:hypothetical protein